MKAAVVTLTVMLVSGAAFAAGGTITIQAQGGGGPYSPGEVVTIELYATGYCGPMGNWLGYIDIAAITVTDEWGSPNPSAVGVGTLASCLMELLGWHVGDIGTGSNLITDIRGRAALSQGCNSCGFVLYEFDLDVGDNAGEFVIDLSGVVAKNPFGQTLSVDVVPLTVTVLEVCEGCPGDADGDEDIDLSDYYAIQGTLAYRYYLCSIFPCGGEEYRVPCDDESVEHLYDECMDTDRDCDVDLDDYYYIQGLLSYVDYLKSGGMGTSYLIDGPNDPIAGHLWPCD